MIHVHCEQIGKNWQKNAPFSQSQFKQILLQDLKNDSRPTNAFQEAAVFDYKGISNPVSLSCFLNISV